MDSRSMEKEVKRVMEEVLRIFEFDIEAFIETSREEKEAIVFRAVLSIIDQNDVPSIEWIRVIEDDEIEEIMDERGEFVVN